MADPSATLNLADFDKWLRKHNRNLLLDVPLVQEEDEALILTLKDNRPLSLRGHVTNACLKQ